MLKKILLSACCALTFGSLLSPNASAQDIGVNIRFGPPEPRMEYQPQARRGHTWSEGHWEWRGRRHTWVKGYWVRNQVGYRYEQAYWEQRGNRWIMHKGKWKYGPTGRDRDSVKDHNDDDYRHGHNSRRD